jgi:alpha-mannosidase
VINQGISLYADSPLIHIRTYGDWLAEQACLKTEFDLAFQAQTIVCDMPYGVMERPSVYSTTKVVGAETVADRVKRGSERDEPDRPMQMWLDFSDGEVAGLGPFEFSYALLPHAGTWREVAYQDVSVDPVPAHELTIYPCVLLWFLWIFTLSWV